MEQRKDGIMSCVIRRCLTVVSAAAAAGLSQRIQKAEERKTNVKTLTLRLK